MAARGELSGALLVAPREDGVAYRPEELEQLAESARHIGVCLEALRVVELERAHRELARRYEELVRGRGAAPTSGSEGGRLLQHLAEDEGRILGPGGPDTRADAHASPFRRGQQRSRLVPGQ
jgi:hypothetical protein